LLRKKQGVSWVLKTSFLFQKRVKPNFFDVKEEQLPQRKKVTAKDAEDGAEDAEEERCEA
jgi:hypothetical protein